MERALCGYREHFTQYHKQSFIFTLGFLNRPKQLWGQIYKETLDRLQIRLGSPRLAQTHRHTYCCLVWNYYLFILLINMYKQYLNDKITSFCSLIICFPNDITAQIFLQTRQGMRDSWTIRSEQTNPDGEWRELIPKTRELILLFLFCKHKTKIWSCK